MRAREEPRFVQRQRLRYWPLRPIGRAYWFDQVRPSSSDQESESTGTDPWPVGVHVKHGRYYLVRREMGSRTWTPLSRCDEGEHALYAALARHHNRATIQTVSDLIDAFLIHASGGLRPKTVKNYQSYAPNLKAVFGHLDPDAIEPGHVARYLEKRRQGGAPVNGNREAEMLSSVYNYGMRNGHARTNPVRFVRRNPERPRRRYITHEQFLDAFNRAPQPLQDLLAMAYLTGLRQKDLRDLTTAQLAPEGIVVDESKTGKRRVVGWTDALRYFVRRACERSGSERVLTNSRGEPWGEWAIQSAMSRLAPGFTFHQIRHKAETDHREGMGLLPLYRRITRHQATR